MDENYTKGIRNINCFPNLEKKTYDCNFEGISLDGKSFMDSAEVSELRFPKGSGMTSNFSITVDFDSGVKCRITEPSKYLWCSD